MSRRRDGAENPPLFSYRKGSSVIHRAPALLKLIALCVISIRTFSSYSADFRKAGAEEILRHGGHSGTAFFLQLTAQEILWLRAAFYALVTAGAFAAARTPLRSLRKILFVPVIGLFVTILKIMPQTAEELFRRTLNVPALLDGLLYTVRLFITSAAALVMFETTSRLALYDAFDAAEAAVGRVIPPVRKLRTARILSVTISFIPEIFRQWRTITLAAKARVPRSAGRRRPARTARRPQSAAERQDLPAECQLQPAERAETRQDFCRPPFMRRRLRISAAARRTATAERQTPPETERREFGGEIPAARRQRLSVARRVSILCAEFAALFYSMLQYAEDTRKAVTNRSA